MHVTQKFQDFEISLEDSNSNYEFLLPILNTFTFDTEEYCLGVTFKVRDCSHITKANFFRILTFITPPPRPPSFQHLLARGTSSHLLTSDFPQPLSPLPISLLMLKTRLETRSTCILHRENIQLTLRNIHKYTSSHTVCHEIYENA